MKRIIPKVMMAVMALPLFEIKIAVPSCMAMHDRKLSPYAFWQFV